MHTLAEVTKTKMEVLFKAAPSFVEQVAATAHLDQKTVVARSILPRAIDSFELFSWETLCGRWRTRVVGSLASEFFVLEMPKGWTVEPLGYDSLFSRVLDEWRRERATIYHQPNAENHAAIFYLNRRYSVFSHYLDPTDPTLRIIAAKDGNRIFREFGRVLAKDPGAARWVERYERAAQEWFDLEYPNWRNPFLYWVSRSC